MAGREAERYLVVGLGNPGPHYETTRHNAGALALDVLLDRTGARLRRRGAADVAEARLSGAWTALARPRSYMNETGAPVAALTAALSVGPDHVVVLHDDLDLPFGALRLKLGGGDAGHNGLRSITRALRTRDYLRVRLGIGRPPGRQDPAAYVLRPYSARERKELPLQLERAADAVERLLADGLAAAQNDYNG